MNLYASFGLLSYAEAHLACPAHPSCLWLLVNLIALQKGNGFSFQCFGAKLWFEFQDSDLGQDLDLLIVPTTRSVSCSGQSIAGRTA
jgi:hypothetical protein